MAFDNFQASSDAATQTLIEQLLLANLKEQRSRRRWGIFFKLFFLFSFLSAIILFLTLFWATPPFANWFNSPAEKTHTSVIEINGLLDDDATADPRNIIESLEDAFKDANTAGIILRINSGGGSGTASSTIFQEIRYLRKQHPKIKVYAICIDICASAAYEIATAADEIYASADSIVGSIGVILEGFGLVDALKKLGIQHRLITAGKYKAFLDPFSPPKEGEVEHAKKMLAESHAHFISQVKLGRGKRLKDYPSIIFSGLPLTSQQGLKYGLIDGIGTVYTVARDIIKNPELVDYTIKPSRLEKVIDRFMGSFFQEATQSLTRKIITH